MAAQAVHPAAPDATTARLAPAGAAQAVHPAAPGAARLLPVAVDGYRPHRLHTGERVWAETNCYVDLWVEVLHAAGLDPVPAAAVALSADFDGTQWSFLKFTPEDLRRLYGIEVAELNVWRPVVEHISEELARGRLLTVEVDSCWLPDTQGTDYRQAHTKTTIVVNELDLAAGRMAYFHNAGYHELGGDDLRALLHLDGRAPELLDPYVELVRLERAHDVTPDAALALFDTHLARAPGDNPVARLAERVLADLDWLSGAGLETYHRWSFGVLRQCGFTAELAADVCRHVADRGVVGAAAAATEFGAVAEAAKAVQFRVARIARGRAGDPGPELTRMVDHWAAATDVLAGSR